GAGGGGGGGGGGRKRGGRPGGAAGGLSRACCGGGGREGGRARLAVGRVAGARLRGSLPLLSHLRRLVKLERARHEAFVETATPLAPELRSSVASNLTRAYGPGVSLAFAENAALIGGMRVKVGSDVYAGSVQKALHALQERF